MLWPKIGTTHYYAQLGLQDNTAIKAGGGGTSPTVQGSARCGKKVGCERGVSLGQGGGKTKLLFPPQNL